MLTNVVLTWAVSVLPLAVYPVNGYAPQTRRNMGSMMCPLIVVPVRLNGDNRHANVVRLLLLLVFLHHPVA
jgi:hypothetical protein